MAEPHTEIDRIAHVLMAAWEEAEGKPVNVSYVATFADMARAVIADQPTSVTTVEWGSQDWAGAPFVVGDARKAADVEAYVNAFGYRNVPVLRRTRTRYDDRVSEWEPLTRPAADGGGDRG